MPLLNNAVGKLTKNADKLGVIYGALAPGEGLTGVINNLMTVLSGGGHIPDVEATIKAYFELPEFKPIAILWLGGLIAKELGYGKYGKPAQKFSEGALKGMALQHILWWSTHGDEGCRPDGTRAMFNRSVVAANQRGYGY